MIIVNDNEEYFGVTVYRIFGKKKDLERQLENRHVHEKNPKNFISFESIESIEPGILTEVWSHKDIAELKYHYDGIQAGYNLITLKRGDIVEFIGVHRILIYYKVMAGGLKRITIDQSMMRKTKY